jgi:hypothetical protein
LENEFVVHFRKDGTPCVPRVVPSAAPSISNGPNPKNIGQSSISHDLIQNDLPFLRDRQLLVDICSWSESVSSYRGFSGTIIQSKCSSLKPGQRVVGLANDQEAANRLVCSAGSIMVLENDEEADLFAEYAVTSAIAALALGPARTAGGASDRPPLKILLADEEAVTNKLSRFCSTFPSLIQAQTSAADLDERFDLILTSSKELTERPEISLLHGTVFVWDDALREATSRDPWTLGYLIKASLSFVKANRLTSEFPFISPGAASQPKAPLPLDNKDSPLVQLLEGISIDRWHG